MDDIAPLVETDRGIGGGTLSPGKAGLDDRFAASLDDDWGLLPDAADIGAGGGGMLPELARLGGAELRGGGGVARTPALELGSFLLTHFFRSLS